MKKYTKFMIFIVFIVGIIVGYSVTNKDDETISNIFDTKDYEVYKSGDKVTFNNENWYVMFDSDKNSDYVTLISSEILYLDDNTLNKVFSGVYETSKINEYLKNNFVNEIGKENFVEINGYQARLFNKDDFEKLIVAKYDEMNDEYTINKCPEFICLTNTFYATMIDTNIQKEFIDVYNNVNDIENLYSDYTLHLRYYNLNSTYSTYKLESLVNDVTLFIRPVVNVYKESLTSD